MTSNSSVDTVAVIGLGNWGTALAHHLAHRGYEVKGWSANPVIVRSIQEDRRNPLYLADVKLHERLTATSSLDEVITSTRIVIALPSHSLSVLRGHLPLLTPNALVVSGVKGVEPHGLLTPLQYVRSHSTHALRTAVLAGPCFARDLVMHRPAGVVAASSSLADAQEAAELFRSANVKVYTSIDPLGVEVGGIVKNVIALAAGVSDGLQYGDSARAGLITRGLAEMTRLAVAMGASFQTLSGLGGLGDLIMTATCNESRNRTVGMRLGKGETLEQIINTLGSTAEAATSTPLVRALAQRYHVEMPITAIIEDLLNGTISAGEGAARLMSRPSRSEFDDAHGVAEV